MKTFSVSIVLLWLSFVPMAFAADAALPTSLESYDYAEPKLFTGTLY